MVRTVCTRFVLAALLGVTLWPALARAEGGNFALPPPTPGLEIRLATGYTVGMGRVGSRSTPGDVVRRSGLGLGLDVDYRSSARWSVGLETQYQELSNGRTATARAFSGNLGGTYHFAPEAIGDPFVRLGTGYRILWETFDQAGPNPQAVRQGFQLASAKIGCDLRVSRDMAFSPILGADLTMFVWDKATDRASALLPSPELAMFVYIGGQVRFN